MKVEEIYQSIAQSIVDSIENEWSNSVLNITYTGNSIEYNLSYSLDNKLENDSDYFGGYEIMEMIDELYKITTQGGNNKWNKLKFELSSEGEMDLEFIWDQELYDELERLSNE